MNQINFHDFGKIYRNKPIAEVLAVLPLEVLSNGEVAFILSKAEDVITLSDLHPRVRHQIKGQEQKARAGMPKVVKLESKVLFEREPSL